MSIPSAADAGLGAARLAILGGAVLFSTGGAAIKACQFTGFQVAGLRSGFASLAILLFLPSSRTWGSRASWLVGAVYAATMVLFVQANTLTTAANTIFLQSTFPIYILLLGPWLLREPIRPRDLVFMAALAGGLGLLFLDAAAPAATAREPFLGNVLATVSGLGLALTLTGIRRLAKDPSGAPPAAAVLSGNVLAFLASLPWVLTAGAGRPQDWLVVAYAGTFQIGLAYVLVTAGMKRLPALEVSLLLMLEPVLNPIWAFLIHGEAPGFWSICGGSVILLATLIKTWWDVRVAPAPADVTAPPAVH